MSNTNRPSDFDAPYSTDLFEIERILEGLGYPTDDIRILHFTDDYALPIWFDGSIVAHQTGEVPVACIGHNHFVGVRRGTLDTIARFRVTYLEAVAHEAKGSV
jgi:hypothetical protein